MGVEGCHMGVEGCYMGRGCRVRPMCRTGTARRPFPTVIHRSSRRGGVSPPAVIPRPVCTPVVGISIPCRLRLPRRCAPRNDTGCSEGRRDGQPVPYGILFTYSLLLLTSITPSSVGCAYTFSPGRRLSARVPHPPLRGPPSPRERVFLRGGDAGAGCREGHPLRHGIRRATSPRGRGCWRCGADCRKNETGGAAEAAPPVGSRYAVTPFHF